MANSRQRRMLGSLALLALAAGGAGAAAYFGVYKAEEAETARKAADEKALAFDAGKLQRLVLTTGAGVVRLERANDLWRIVAPIEAPADPEAVTSIIRRLEGLKLEGVVADDTARAAEFGLASGTVAAQLTWDDNGTSRSVGVVVGGVSPVGGKPYLTREGDGRIHLGDSGLREALDRKTFDLRDRRLVPAADWELSAIAGGEAEGAWRLAKADDGTWSLKAPVEDKADKSTVDELISALSTSKASSVVLEASSLSQEGALAKYGLDAPPLRLAVTWGADKRQTRLALAVVENAGTRHTYARDEAGGPVLEFDEALLKRLSRSWTMLRDRTISSFATAAVRGVELTPAGGATVRVTRTPGKSALETVFAVDGRSDGLRTDLLDQMVSMLSQLRASEVVDPAGRTPAQLGLDKPDLQVKVTGEGGAVLAEFAVGAVTPAAEGGERRFVRPAAGGRLMELERGTLDAIPRTVAALTLDAPAAADKPASDASSAKSE